MRRYVPKLRLFHKGSDATLAALEEARSLIAARAGRPAPVQRAPARPPPGKAAAAAADAQAPAAADTAAAAAAGGAKAAAEPTAAEPAASAH